MPFDSSRVKNNAEDIQQHLNDFETGVTSVDSWEMVIENNNGGYVIVTIEYTA